MYREPWNKLIYTRSTDRQQGSKNNTVEKNKYFQQMVLEKVGTHMQKNKIGLLPYSIHKNQFRMDWICLLYTSDAADDYLTV